MAVVGEFGGALSAEFPFQINVDVTEFCNLACIHCPYDTVIKPKGKARNQLDEGLHRRMIDQVSTDGRGHCRFIRYTGEGEPLLHPKLPSMISDAALRTGLPINLTTNGLLLTEGRARALIDAGVSVFDISIDAHQAETYAAIRVGGDLSVCQANVLSLIRLIRSVTQRPAPKVMVSFVQQPLNQSEAQLFKTFWEAEGVDFVVLRNQHSCAGAVADISAQMWGEAPKLRRPCLYPWERLVVKPDGKFSFCPADWSREADIGSLALDAIRDVWRGPDMEALRQAHRTGDFAKHALCGRCPDWSVIRWPWEGRNYATVMREFAEKRPPGSLGCGAEA